MSIATLGQQSRLATKLKRNLQQVLVKADGIEVTVAANGFDYLIKVKEAGTWATGKFHVLLKLKDMDLSQFPVQGFPVQKVLLAYESVLAGETSDNRAAACRADLLAELICRVKELGCSIEIVAGATATDPLTLDVATAEGEVTGTKLRHIRASVDTIGMGQ